MRASLRLAFAIAAFFGAWLAMFLLTTVLLPESLAWAQPLVALVFAIWGARRVWLQLETPERDGLPVYAGTGALVLGGIGFAGGFFGPMLLAPEANQGPLLGMFVTGPGGALLGAVIGWLLWVKRRG
jgi:hypothetical protein